MSNSLRFLGLCLVVSMGLAVLELVAFVGISNVIAIPFTIFHAATQRFFLAIGVIMAVLIACYGLINLARHRWVIGTSVTLSIGWAFVMTWVLTTSAAFTSVPTL